jgi:hypothetical protein
MRGHVQSCESRALHYCLTQHSYPWEGALMRKYLIKLLNKKESMHIHSKDSSQLYH